MPGPSSIVHRQSSIPNRQSPIAHRPSLILIWVRSNLRLIVVTEILFLLAFAFLAVVRAANPEILGTEKPMELMLINSILHSPSFPPHDSWLSGYAISYYYFGYVMTAMLARLTSVPGTLAFNLMISLVFALGAAGAYGVLYNLLNRQSSISDHQSSDQNRQSSIVNRQPLIALPLLGPLFLLIVSNIEGFLELLHSRGLFWTQAADGSYVSPFWTWLDLNDLKVPPPQPLNWLPERFWWWWRASRVVQDYDLLHNPQEIIDEFPFFSFLLGDLHPHVLAIPFGLLAIGVALNLFLGGWSGEIRLLGVRLHLKPVGFLTIALVLGGLAFLNTWDILVAAALVVCAYVLSRVRTEGWAWSRLEDAFVLGVPVGIAALVLYFPFYLGFSSQAGGPLPNLINPTRGAHLWLMFGSLLLPLLVYLVYRVRRAPVRWTPAIILTLGLTLLLWVLSWGLAFLIQWRDPGFTQQYLQSQGGLTMAQFFGQAVARRLDSLGSLLTILAVLCPSLALLIASAHGSQSDDQPQEEMAIANRQSSIVNPQSSIANRQSSILNRQSSIPFVLLMIFLGALLVLAPEFVYLRDQFGWRINTIFKFYYQAWFLWSLAAAFGVAILLQHLRGLADWIFRVFLVLLLFMALVYPVLGIATKTNNFQPYFGFTLDDFDRVEREAPDEAAAMKFLMGAPQGVIAEAASIGGSYTNYGRFATYTGLPDVLGWPGHESQWRGSYLPQGSRLDDLQILYTSTDWAAAQEIIKRYDIRYIVVAGLERTTYTLSDQGLVVHEEKFAGHLPVVFQQGEVTVYEVP